MVLKSQVFNITNAEPVLFWIFASTLLIRLGYEPPRKKLPYTFIYALAWFLYFLAIMIRPIYRWQPFLSPFKVALAGTHHYYSCKKAEKVLGYKPVVSLEDGIQMTVKSMENLRADFGRRGKKVD